jgi:hypothetical protein
MGHVVEGGLHAFDGEQFPRRREHALPVALGVFAQALARLVNHLAEFSDVHNSRGINGLTLSTSTLRLPT